jgi:hypothetical protein
MNAAEYVAIVVGMFHDKWIDQILEYYPWVWPLLLICFERIPTIHSSHISVRYPLQEIIGQ